MLIRQAGGHAFNIPESWEELSFEQVERINHFVSRPQQDPVAQDAIIIHTLLCLDWSIIADVTDADLHGKFNSAIEFFTQNKAPDWRKYPLPLEVDILGRKILFTNGVKFTADLNARLILLLKKQDGRAVVDTGALLATYLQPLLNNGIYDKSAVIEVEREVVKLPAVKVYPIVFELEKHIKKMLPEN